jgi:PAS domain S-box-containing protein
VIKEHLSVLGLDFAVLLLLGLGQSALDRWLIGWPARARAVASGLWFGTDAIATILLAVPVTSGVLLDVRGVVILAASAFCGRIAGIIATLMAIGFRLTFGGLGMWPGVGMAITMLLLGVAFAPWARFDRGLHRPIAFALLGAAAQMAWLLAMPWDVAVGAFFTSWLIVLVSYVLGFLLVGLVIVRERERSERERRLRAVLDWTPSFIGLLDPSGRVIQANRTALEYIGADEQQVRGLPFWQCPWCGGDPETGERFRHAVKEAAAGKAVRLEAELAGSRLRCRTFDFQLHPVRDDAGRVVMLLPEGRDITEQKEAQGRLRETEDSLHQAQKMQAVGQLTGGIAHDFNNLLAIAHGNLELMQRQPLGAELRRLVDAALRAVSRGATLTQHLLAFSRKQHLMPTVVATNQIVAETATMLRRILGDSIVVRTELALDLRFGYFDPTQLETALLNLAINARDAMPDGGILTISTSNACLEMPIVEEVPPGEYLRLVVRDTGYGMSSEVLHRAFEPFFTTKPVGRGSGLGLSMVYGFIKQSGGHIELDSAPGHGTTVVIFLPAAEGSEAEELADGSLLTAAL